MSEPSTPITPTVGVIDLVQPVLGLNPYVLLECVPGDGVQFDIRVRAGGGIGSRDTITAVLLLALETITGVPTDTYALEVDITRRAAGLPPLNEVT